MGYREQPNSISKPAEAGRPNCVTGMVCRCRPNFYLTNKSCWFQGFKSNSGGRST